MALEGATAIGLKHVLTVTARAASSLKASRLTWKTPNFFPKEQPKMTYRERELSALWDAYKMARSLAHRCLRLGLQYPNYAADEKEEAARHFERAQWWLDSFRMMRASQ
jgi:hypothetical protein